MNVALLADAMDAAEPLFQARRVPRQVVVDHQPAELKVDAFAGRLGRDANLLLGAEFLLGALALVRIHAAVNLAGGVTPFCQMFAEVVQRVAVLGEDEQLARGRRLSSLNSARARHALRAASLESLAVIAHAAGLGEQFLQRGDFGPQLIQFTRGGELVGELVAFGVVEVVLVLLGVGQAALQLGQPAGALRGRQVFQLVQEVLLSFQAGAGWIQKLPASNWRVGAGRRCGQGDARLLAAAGLRQELVDVGGDGLVEVVFLRFSLNATVCAWRSGKSRRPCRSWRSSFSRRNAHGQSGPRRRMSRRISVAWLPTRCGSGNRSESISRMKWAKRSSSPWCGVAVSRSRWSAVAASCSASW